MWPSGFSWNIQWPSRPIALLSFWNAWNAQNEWGGWSTWYIGNFTPPLKAGSRRWFRGTFVLLTTFVLLVSSGLQGVTKIYLEPHLPEIPMKPGVRAVFPNLGGWDPPRQWETRSSHLRGVGTCGIVVKALIGGEVVTVAGKLEFWICTASYQLSSNHPLFSIPALLLPSVMVGNHYVEHSALPCILSRLQEGGGQHEPFLPAVKDWMSVNKPKLLQTRWRCTWLGAGPTWEQVYNMFWMRCLFPWKGWFAVWRCTARAAPYANRPPYGRPNGSCVKELLFSR